MLSSVFPLSGRENKAFYTSHSKAAPFCFMAKSAITYLRTVTEAVLYQQIEFWDTAVSEDIRSATGTYYYQAAAALFMYDATRMDSLHHLHHCHDKLNTFSMGNVVKVLIGINCGEEDVEVSEIEAEAFKDMFEMSLAIRMCRISEEEIKTLIDGVTKALSENSLLRMTDYPPPTDDDDERTTKLCHCCKTS